MDCGDHGFCRKGAKDTSFIDNFDFDDRRLTERFNQEFEHCVCEPGWAGLNCDVKMDVCPGRSMICLHGSTCDLSEETGQFGCNCAGANEGGFKYAGKYCQYYSTSYCTIDGRKPKKRSDAFCTNNGLCLDFVRHDGEHPGCTCDDNFEGDHCETLIHHPAQKAPESLNESGSSGARWLTTIAVIFFVLLLLILAYVCYRQQRMRYMYKHGYSEPESNTFRQYFDFKAGRRINKGKVVPFHPKLESISEEKSCGDTSRLKDSNSMDNSSHERTHSGKDTFEDEFNGRNENEVELARVSSSPGTLDSIEEAGGHAEQHEATLTKNDSSMQQSGARERRAIPARSVFAFFSNVLKQTESPTNDGSAANKKLSQGDEEEETVRLVVKGDPERAVKQTSSFDSGHMSSDIGSMSSIESKEESEKLVAPAGSASPKIRGESKYSLSKDHIDQKNGLPANTTDGVVSFAHATECTSRGSARNGLAKDNNGAGNGNSCQASNRATTDSDSPNSGDGKEGDRLSKGYNLLSGASARRHHYKSLGADQEESSVNHPWRGKSAQRRASRIFFEERSIQSKAISTGDVPNPEVKPGTTPSGPNLERPNDGTNDQSKDECTQQFKAMNTREEAHPHGNATNTHDRMNHSITVGNRSEHTVQGKVAGNGNESNVPVGVTNATPGHSGGSNESSDPSIRDRERTLLTAIGLWGSNIWGKKGNPDQDVESDSSGSETEEDSQSDGTDTDGTSSGSMSSTEGTKFKSLAPNLTLRRSVSFKPTDTHEIKTGVKGENRSAKSKTVDTRETAIAAQSKNQKSSAASLRDQNGHSKSKTGGTESHTSATKVNGSIGYSKSGSFKEVQGIQPNKGAIFRGEKQPVQSQGTRKDQPLSQSGSPSTTRVAAIPEEMSGQSKAAEIRPEQAFTSHTKDSTVVKSDKSSLRNKESTLPGGAAQSKAVVKQDAKQTINSKSNATQHEEQVIKSNDVKAQRDGRITPSERTSSQVNQPNTESTTSGSLGAKQNVESKVTESKNGVEKKTGSKDGVEKSKPRTKQEDQTPKPKSTRTATSDREEQNSNPTAKGNQQQEDNPKPNATRSSIDDQKAKSKTDENKKEVPNTKSMENGNKTGKKAGKVKAANLDNRNQSSVRKAPSAGDEGLGAQPQLIVTSGERSLQSKLTDIGLSTSWSEESICFKSSSTSTSAGAFSENSTLGSLSEPGRMPIAEKGLTRAVPLSTADPWADDRNKQNLYSSNRNRTTSRSMDNNRNQHNVVSSGSLAESESASTITSFEAWEKEAASPGLDIV